MQHYYSPTTKGFYNEGVHGARRIQIDDPAWVRPTVTVTAKDGKPERTEEVPDHAAVGTMITVDNPDCKLPADAVEIAKDAYDALFAGQAAGKLITQDKDGNPVLVDHPVDDAGAARALLAASDTVVLRCVERGVAVPPEWLSYRRALRAVVAGGKGSLPAAPAYPAGT